MRQAVIVDVLRTPIGKRNGALSKLHPADLVATLLGSLAERNSIDPTQIDEVILGCATQIGAQSMNLARNSVLAANWPDSVPGTTIEKRQGSSQQAIHFAAQGIISGAYDLVVAGGVENMSLVPLGAAVGPKMGQPYSNAVNARFETTGGLKPVGIATEQQALKQGLRRETMDEYAAASHARALAAQKQGSFANEIVNSSFAANEDECVAKTSAEKLAVYKPCFAAEGVLTAGNIAPAADGAAAVLIACESTAERLGLTVRAKFAGFASAATSPQDHLSAAALATQSLLKNIGLQADAIDTFEIDESSAAAVLSWARHSQIGLERINPRGGAIALGNPAGAAGARMLATLVNHLEITNTSRGVVAGSFEGGLANAFAIER